MATTLVIVESPTKAKTFSKYLESWRPRVYDVASSVGHIIDLPEKELGVDLEQGFKPHYVPVRGKTRVINDLKKRARAVDQVLIATDLDREGEAIAWHIANELGRATKGRVGIQRICFNEITKKAIIEAVQKPDSINQNRVDAQQARRVMDRLVGYQVSPILWKTVSRGLSAGRVQSVAVRLICEREQEIEAFVPQEYWSFDANFLSEAGEEFHAQLLRLFEDAQSAQRGIGDARAGEKPAVSSAEEAEAIKRAMEAASWQVAKINEKDVARKAPAPFITSTLQQDAARRLGFSPRKTMMLAQQLYEGVELDGGESVGLITYMRTDSTRLADSALEEVRAWISENLGPEQVPEKPQQYRGKKRAQDAHEAIRPTSALLTPESVKAALQRDQFRLYQLIWRRFVACQMVPALFRQRSIDLLGDRFLCRATGSVLVRKGFLEVYGEVAESRKSGQKEEKPIPANLHEGEKAELKELVPEQHFTKPPARFSQESLIRTLEEQGIGRPSTYATIVDMILKRSYVELKEKRFHPTDLGKTVNHILVTHFAGIFNVDFTAGMETELDSIEGGESWQKVLDDFYTPFSKALKTAEANARAIKEEVTESVGEACPECGKDLLYKWGRNGRFIACSGFPECRYTRNPDEDDGDRQTDEICDKCGAPMAVKASRFGRFLGCSNYPKCRNIKPIDLGIECPKEGCKGRITERRSRRGRVFFGCSEYPKCDFASWDKPVNRSCPSCSNNYMVERFSDGRKQLRCPVCKTEIEVEE